MEILSRFGERVAELVFDAEIDNRTLAVAIGVDVTTVCRWRRGALDISLSHLVKLADYFSCSIDFLVGRCENPTASPVSGCTSFYQRLRTIMEKNGVSRYRLVKDTPIYDSYFTGWKRGVDVQLSTLTLLANYFDCSIDYLVGREN